MLHAMRIGAGGLGADPVDFLVWTPVPLLFGGLSPRRDPHHHRHRRTDRAGHQPHPRTRSRWHSGGRLRHCDGLGIQLLQKVDFHQQSNRVIAAVALAVGLLPILIPGFYDKFPADVRILLDSGVAVGPSPQPSSTSSSITWGPGAATPRTATSPRSSTTSTTTPWRHRSKTRPGGAGSRSRRATAHRTPVGWPHARSRTRTDDRLRPHRPRPRRAAPRTWMGAAAGRPRSSPGRPGPPPRRPGSRPERDRGEPPPGPHPG